MKNLFLLSICFFCSFLSFSNNTDDSKKSEEEAKKGAFTLSGYVDSYYIGNFNRPASRSNMGVSNARAFDQRSGQFSLGLVQTKMQYTNAKSDVVVDMAFGPNADLGNYGNVLGAIGGNTNTALAIKQAYFDWKPTDKFTLTAGQFGTHIGYEVIDAPVNFSYSLSNLFNNGPFYHIGIKGTYAFSDRISLMLGVVNNVDNLNDNNRKKGLIAQLYLSPVENWKVYLNALSSNEADEEAKGVTPDAYYRLLDLTTTFQVTEKLMMGLNAAYGAQKGKFHEVLGDSKVHPWGGAAGYLNYTFSKVFSVGTRYEYFDNSSAARGLLNANDEGTSVNSLTLTANFSLADDHLLIKPEFRMDAYKKLTGAGQDQMQQFEDSDGNFTKNAQSTLGIAFIYKF